MESVDFMFGKIHKDIPVPMYYQIKQVILTAIKNGLLQPGEMLPIELAFCEQYEVSRPTIRQALNELVIEGYLYRLKGKGTFVSSPKIEAKFLSKLQNFNDEMLAKGLTPSTKVITFKVISGVQDINNRLKRPNSEKLFYLERVRFANGEPVVYVETFFSYDQFQKLENVDFVSESLYDSMKLKCNCTVARVNRMIEAVSVSQKEATLLEIVKGSAAMLVKTTAFTKQGIPVEYSIARYRGDRNQFSVELELE